EDLIREFSQRSILIEQRTDELIEQYINDYGHRPSQGVLLQLRQDATLDTRRAKTDIKESLAEKMSAWRERSLPAGHEPATVIANATGHESAVISADRPTVEVRPLLPVWILSDTSATRSTFTRA